MKPQDKTQSDLFEQAQSAEKRIKRKTRFLLLPDIKNSLTLSYEAVIFAMICSLMACIISFSLGVEKGRRDAMYERGRRASAPETKKGVSNVSTPKPKNVKGR